MIYAKLEYENTYLYLELQFLAGVGEPARDDCMWPPEASHTNAYNI